MYHLVIILIFHLILQINPLNLKIFSMINHLINFQDLIIINLISNCIINLIKQIFH